jgi:hypothetical protein
LLKTDGGTVMRNHFDVTKRCDEFPSTYFLHKDLAFYAAEYGKKKLEHKP